MSVVKGKHWPAGTPFIGAAPGDWVFDDERPGAEERGMTRPKCIYFECPRGQKQCAVPIAPEATLKGHTWQWNGDRERPTLTPSINCLSRGPNGEEYAGCGWHGFLTDGEFRECG